MMRSRHNHGALQGLAPLVSFLVSYGADLTAVNNNGTYRAPGLWCKCGMLGECAHAINDACSSHAPIQTPLQLDKRRPAPKDVPCGGAVGWLRTLNSSLTWSSGNRKDLVKSNAYSA